jgi:hypothetical protein
VCTYENADYLQVQGRAFDSTILRKTFGRKRYEVTSDLRKLCKEESFLYLRF